MLFFNPLRWLKSWTQSRRGRTYVKNRRSRLSIEELETRLAPAAFVWTGNDHAVTTNWSDGNNWQGLVAPNNSVGAAQLVFNNTASFFTSNNNISGLTVDQMTVASGTYTISMSAGDQITLGNSSTNTGLLLVNTGAVANISIDMQMGFAASSTEILNVQSGASLNMSGQISGSSVAQLTMQGAGTLTLSHDNSTFAGPFKIDDTAGNGVCIITNANALGTGTVTVTTNTQLQVNLPADGTINNNLVLNGAGPGGTTGALYMNPSGPGPITVTWAGNVQMNSTNGVSNTTIAVTDVTGPVTGASSTSPIVITTTSTANLYNNEIVTINGVGGNTYANNQWQITVLSPTTFSLANSNPGPVPFTTPGTWTAYPYTLAITGQISNSSTSPYTLTKEGPGTLYLNPLNAAGNTYGGNTLVNQGTLSIGHPFALGPGGGTTIVDSNPQKSGTLALNYTSNPFIPVADLYYAQVQTVTLAGQTAGTTQFTLNYNGASTGAITYNAGIGPAVAAALNGLSTIGGIGASVQVTQAGSTFNVTFGGSLGGMQIPTLTAAVSTGPGAVSVGTAAGVVPIGFKEIGRASCRERV